MSFQIYQGTTSGATSSGLIGDVTSFMGAEIDFTNPYSGDIITYYDNKWNIGFTNYKYIERLADFPTPVSNVITLKENLTYYITTNIDLGENRLSCSGICSIIGTSSETSSLTSTTAGALITAVDTFVIRWITFTNTVGTVFDMDASLGTNTNPALDWFGVNFLNCPTIGTIKDYSNFIGFSMAFLTSGNLTFDGSIGTIAFDTSIFTNPTGTTIILPSTLTVTRRIRIQFSSFVVTGANSAINLDVGATIPNDQYVIFRCNFAGGATNMLLGVDSTDNKAGFVQNSGIPNSISYSSYYMTSNSTLTTISVQGTYYKILGTTTSGTLTQRFTNTNNRATFTGTVNGFFKVDCILTVIESNNILFSICIAKNGIAIPSSQSTFTTSGNSKAENVSVTDVVEIETDDYIEIFIANLTSTSNPTVTELHAHVQRLTL